jgi:hypothetical protein
MTVSAANVPGGSTASLAIEVNGRKARAFADSVASHNFIHPRLISQGMRVHPGTKTAFLAVNGAGFHVEGNCTLRVTVADIASACDFCVTPGLRYDIVLGRDWLKDNQVLHDHQLDCVYIGRNRRKRVFLGWTQRNAPEKMPDELWRKFQHEFPKQHERVFRELLGRHQEIFDGNGPLKQMRFATHDLKLMCEKPFRLPPYRYSTEKKKALQQQVTLMLADGIIEATSSPYSTPIVMVTKKDDRYRFCVDYRRLNSITEDSAQPQPVIHEVLKDLGNATIFSTLDLRSGY